jgi:hypothetical protein
VGSYLSGYWTDQIFQNALRKYFGKRLASFIDSKRFRHGHGTV